MLHIGFLSDSAPGENQNSMIRSQASQEPTSGNGAFLHLRRMGIMGLLAVLTILSGCSRRAPIPPPPTPRESRPVTPRPTPPTKPEAPRAARPLQRAGWAIQVGAFAQVENAARLTHQLEDQGLEAYYYLYRSGLFKVRFGDYASREAARREAESLVSQGVLKDYYLVSPDTYSVERLPELGQDYLRERLVQAARSYLGVPYQWGGTSPENGFDCSGLVMAIYKLNGINIPRTSREQFDSGTPISSRRLSPGDLVFFSTQGGHRISHVGIYVGDGEFIHAPGEGKQIRVDLLSRPYYEEHFRGARSFLE